ncbi:MAG TPA: SDR family oxidoreductase [Gemmataceae bacterium]|nr:SDR family oxidoreductase [Gemmataceae bacterium]
MGHRRKIKDSRLLITGASQGIGRALALAAVRKGGKVLAAARSEDLLRQLADEARGTGGTLVTVKADVTSHDDRQAMVDAARSAFGGLDVLINNAGIGATGHFAEVAPDRLRKIMEVNFFGLTETTRVFLPLLKEGVRPAIVNISSIAGRRGIPARSEYSASKFAVQGFSEALRAELYKDGIDVLLINPGLTQTNFSKNMLEQKAKLQMDHLRGMTAEDAALATLRAIERGSNEVTLGFKGKLLVFVCRFFPWLADRIARKRVRELFKDEIEARHRQQAGPTHAPVG